MNSKFSSHVPLFAVISGIVLYSVIYSFITVAKFNTYNASIFDLGVNAQLLYGVFHGGVSIFPGSQGFINTGKMIYLVLAPFYNIYPHEQVLLIFQSVWIALGALPIYFLANRRLHDGFVSVALSFVWLLYYPMAGVNWFDFHFMALFPTFFLIGLAFLEYDKKKAAFVFLALSVTTDFLIPLVMILFGLMLLYRNYRDGERIRKNRLALSLIIISLAILAMTNILYGLNYTTSYAYNSATQLAVFRTSNWNIALYFVRILLPLGFISILAPEYMILLIPFLLLATYSHYSPYTGTMFYQYPALTAPIVFISAVKGGANLGSLVKAGRWKFSLKKFVSVILIFNFILALFLTPAGNLVTSGIHGSSAGYYVTGSAGSYQTNNVISAHSYDKAISEMISMMPSGSTVLAQNNLPQVAQGNTLVMPSHILENLSEAHYPQYVLVDPYNPFFTNAVFPGSSQNLNAMNAFNLLFKTGEYGIYGEANGIILLKLHYRSAPLLDEPLNCTFTLPDFNIPSYITQENVSGSVYLDGLNGGTAWYGPYVTLPPGYYNLTVVLHSNSLNMNDSLLFQVSSFTTSSTNTTIILEKSINSTTFLSSGTLVEHLHFYNPEYSLNVEFRGIDATWHSPLSLQYISLVQDARAT